MRLFTLPIYRESKLLVIKEPIGEWEEFDESEHFVKGLWDRLHNPNPVDFWHWTIQRMDRDSKGDL